MSLEGKSKSYWVRYYMVELVKDKGKVTTQEIKEYVWDKMGKERVTSGIMSSAIRDALIEEPRLVNYERGKYMWTEDKSTLKLYIKRLLEGVRKNATKKINEINLMDIDGDEVDEVFEDVKDAREAIKRVSEIEESIDSLLKADNK